MTKEQTAAVVHRLRIAYRCDVDADQYQLWHDHLAGRDFDMACRAADAMIASGGQFFPTISAYNTAYLDTVRRDAAQHEERMLGAPTRPCVCVDGFVEVEAETGAAMTVDRCPRCNQRDSNTEHVKHCTCMTCKYGPRLAAEIRAGYTPRTPAAAASRQLPLDNRYETDF